MATPAAQRLISALLGSVLLHVVLLLLPGADLKVSGNRAGAPLEARLLPPDEPASMAVISSPGTRPPVASHLEGAQAAEQIPIPRPHDQEAAVRPSASETTPPSSAAPLTGSAEGEIHVRELMPEEVDTPIELGDPSIPWNDAGMLTKRPLALGMLDLTLPDPGPWRWREGGVRIAIRITEKGEVHGVQLLTPPSPLDAPLLAAMAAMRFTPGEVRGQPVPSILLLEFSLGE